MNKLITQGLLWLLLVVAPALALFAPDTFQASAPQLFGWVVTAVALACSLAVSVDMAMASQGQTAAVERIIERYGKVKTYTIISSGRSALACMLYFVLGFGWLAFFFAIAVLSTITVKHLSNKLAEKLITGEVGRPLYDSTRYSS